MLLDHEKDGIGPRRLTRAVALLEAAGVVSQFECDEKSVPARIALSKAAEALRQMAISERAAFDAEKLREAKAARDL